MFKLSTKTSYGTRTMLDLALNHSKGLALLKDIAIRQNISLGYLEQIIPSLKSAGLVSSRRGAYGGYELAKPPSQITIKDIVNALAGPIFLIESGTASEGSYKSGQCVTMDIWNELSELINLTLSSQTLEDLVNKHNSRQKNTLSMYYI